MIKGYSEALFSFQVSQFCLKFEKSLKILSKTFYLLMFRAFLLLWLYDVRSSGSQILFKIGILKNFANFTGEQLCWSFFLLKLKAFRPLLRTPFLREHLPWLLICERLCIGETYHLFCFCLIEKNTLN